MRSFPTMSVGLSAAVILATATPDTRSQEEPAPVPVPLEERVVVQLVQIPFVATDRQGRPITDLTLDEIEVKARGVDPRVVYLERLGAIESIEAEEELPEVRLLLDAPGGWSAPTSTRGSSRYLAIVIDNENDPPLRREEAILEVIKFLENDVDPELRVAVLSYSGTLELEVPFTTDREAVKSAVRIATTREGRPRVDPRIRMRQLLSRFDDCVIQRGDFTSTADPQCVRDVSNEYVGEMSPRSDDLLVGLEGLVEYMGGLQGRKGVFVLGHGFPIDLSPVLMESARAIFGNTDSLSDLRLYLGFGDNPRVKMDRLIESLIRQRVTMTFVDRTSPPSGDTGASRGQALVPGTSPMRAEYEAAVADMEQIAYSSGGIHIRSTDMGEGLDRALSAQEGAYELGFQLSEYLDPDKLAKINLDCKRRGVKLYHRRGVYAAPSQAEQSLRGGFSFRKGRPLEGARAPGIHQPFLLAVDPDSIGYDLDGAGARADFTVHMIVERRSDARRLADTYHFVNHAYDREHWDAKDRVPMTLAGWVELPPGDFLLRAWIRNVRSGREGVIQQPVRVPEVLAEDASDDGRSIAPPETSSPPPESKPPDSE